MLLNILTINFTMNNYKTKTEILSLLNISALTLDNWIKNFIPHGYSNNHYDLNVILDFIKKEKKLSTRANKKLCCSNEVPKELLKYLINDRWVSAYLEYIHDKDYHAVAQELINTYTSRVNNTISNHILESIIPYNEMYAFSVAYQILINSGQKSKTGAYYTPKFIINDILETNIQENKTILEPCCGVGFFVMQYILIYQEKFNTLPQNLIYCNDIDNYAVEITKLNIQYHFPDLLFVINCEDGLNLNYQQKFDFILTNPPYGIKNKYESLKTTEIFSQFIYCALFKYLKKDGIMNFVLPSSVLSVQKHKEIRKIILEQFSVEKIKFYGKSFHDVFSDIVYIQIKNTNTINKKVLFILQDLFYLSQQQFIDNNYIISCEGLSNNSNIEHYYKIPHITLKEAKFSLGIVTGNNKFFISDIFKDNSLPILSGKEIEPGRIIYENQKYILNLFDKFQQKSKHSHYLQTKIVYRFISHKIISAVDYSGTLTLNSANFFFIEDINLCPEYISAILNSDIINKINKIKNGHNIKVLKQHLIHLPIFIFSKSIQKIIVNNYKKGFHNENNLIIEKQIRLFLINVESSQQSILN